MYTCVYFVFNISLINFQNFYFQEDPPLETYIEYTENGWPAPHRPFGNHFFLNWSNPLVQMEMRSVMELWLSLGVDGFYMKHLENLHINNPAHYLTIIHQWRYVLDKYSVNSTRKVLMMSHDNTMYLKSVMNHHRYLSIPSMIDMVDVSIKLVNNGSSIDIGDDIREVRKFWDQYPVSPVTVWHVGSAETMRLANRIGHGANVAGFLLVSILPGTFSCFYGDEIGLQNSYEHISNKVSLPQKICK